MSDDKKRDRAMQRRVRERQAKTGENYQTAWRQLTADTAPNPSNKPEASRGARRVPLPMGTGVKVLPGQSAQVTARPQLDSFWPERFLIKNADHWDIHRLAVEKGNGSLLETEPRTATTFSLDTWRPLTEREVRCGESVVATVTYTGRNKEGESFEATMFGWEGGPPATSTDRNEAPASERVSERAESSSVAVHEAVQLPLTITHPALFVDRLTITNAKDWVVNDIKTRGKTIFVQSGDVPGEMFSESARVVLEPLAAEDRVTVIATYVGNDSSARLVVTLSGTLTSTNSPRVCSYFLPMSTGVPIEPRQSAQITGRPQSNFLPERLVIADPDAWIINDIKIGIRSQLAAAGDIPGQSFSSRTVGGHVTLDPVRRGQDFIVVTTRDNDCKKSAGFFCGVQGRALQRSERERQANTDELLVTATEIDDDAAGSFARRLVLPLHLPRVPPHQPTRVAARTDGAIDVEGIYISGAGTLGGTADWIVNDIEIDGQSQLARKDLPGELFGGRGLAASHRATTKLSLEGFDPVERNRELALTVTYVGQNPEGAPFFASAVGSKPQQRPTIVPIATKSPLLPTAKTTITTRVQSTPFQMARLEIDNGDTPGGAADWIVGDLRINGKSQFVQSGDLPGDLFAVSAIDTFVKLEACEAGNTIELDMLYIGLNEHGAIFAARLEGTVLRDDYSVPPPDLHVVVETSGQGPGEVVIATCNWRAPATDNRTR